MDHAQLTVVRTFLNRIEAELAKSALEAASIESTVSADEAGGLYPSMWVSTGVKLLVRPEDVDRAEDVLGIGCD